MSAAYQHLALSEVKPGMILSDELLDHQGQVLLPKGARLTAKIIGLLPGHGIEMLAVLRAPGDIDPGQAVDDSVVERRLAHLFRKNNSPEGDDWATNILQRYISDFRMKREIEP